MLNKSSHRIVQVVSYEIFHTYTKMFSFFTSSLELGDAQRNLAFKLPRIITYGKVLRWILHASTTSLVFYPDLS